MKVKALTP